MTFLCFCTACQNAVVLHHTNHHLMIYALLVSTLKRWTIEHTAVNCAQHNAVLELNSHWMVNPTIDPSPDAFPPIPMWPPLLNVAPLVLASPLNPTRIGSKRSLIAIKPSATPPTSNQSSFSQSIIFDTRPLSLQLWIWSFLLAEHWLNKEQNDHRRHLILRNIVITSK